MPAPSFASALSQHPVASSATGEVAGSILESLGGQPDLVMLTATTSHAGALEDIASAVASVLQPEAMVGCTAESVIGTGHEVERSPAISLWAGRTGPVLPVTLQATRVADDAWHFDGWPGSPPFEPRVLLLVADPFTFPAEQLLEWLADRVPGLPVVGGNASGARGPGGTRLVAGGTVLRDGAVGVLLGPGAEVEPVVSQGAWPYGHPLTVTRCDRNIIHEVAGQPAVDSMVEQIQHGLGAAEVADIPGSGLFVGRLVDQHVTEPGPGDYLVRRINGVDRPTGAMAVEDRVPLGATVQFHLRNANSADRHLDAVLAGRRADAALAFTCNGRGTRLFDKSDHDAGALVRHLGPVPVGGFFAAGEIGPVGGQNFLHGKSASLVLFRDHPAPSGAG